jgi:general nucleoside transport system permease protein
MMAIIVGIASSSLRLVTPYLFAAVGETLSQASGVLNLGLDGIMLVGAYAAFYVGVTTGSLAAGVLAAALVGGLLGLIMAFVSVTMRADQGVSGIALYLFCLGLTEMLFKQTLGGVRTITGLQPLDIPILSKIPVLGPVLFHQNILTYVAFALVPLTWFVLNRTTFGLKIRAVGENPHAADSLGVRVRRVRYQTVTLGGVLAGVAGASLSIALLNLFQPNLTNGMGFIAVALVYFGGWRPVRVLLGALLFSTVNALQIWAQVEGVGISPYLTLMLPYVITIVVLASMKKRNSQAPSGLAKPFERE